MTRAARGLAACAALVAWMHVSAPAVALAAIVETAPTSGREAGPVPARSSSGIPALTGPVVDEAGILDAATRRAIEARSLEVKQATSAEIAVLVVRTTAPLDEFSYGMKVVGEWKLGSEKKDDGLLFLVAVEDRRARFFTGYGLEGVLPDGRLGKVLDDFVIPQFRKGDYPAGILAGVNEIARILQSEYDGEAFRPAPRQRGTGSLLPLIVVLLIWFFVLRGMSGRRRRRYYPIFWGGGFGGGPMSGGFGGGFGGGGGGFDGGFGGGGGGFGGGGAGRSW